MWVCLYVFCVSVRMSTKSKKRILADKRLQLLMITNASKGRCGVCVCVCACVRVCTYMSLHGVLVQLQVLFGGSLLHELGAELIDLVSAPGHSVCQHLRTTSLLLQLQLHTLQLVLTETR